MNRHEQNGMNIKKRVKRKFSRTNFPIFYEEKNEIPNIQRNDWSQCWLGVWQEINKRKSKTFFSNNFLNLQQKQTSIRCVIQSSTRKDGINTEKQTKVDFAKEICSVSNESKILRMSLIGWIRTTFCPKLHKQYHMNVKR